MKTESKKKYSLLYRDNDYLNVLNSIELNVLVKFIEDKDMLSGTIVNVNSSEVLLCGYKGEISFIILDKNDMTEKRMAMKSLEIHDQTVFFNSMKDREFYKFESMNGEFGFLDTETSDFIKMSSAHADIVVHEDKVRRVYKSKSLSYVNACISMNQIIKKNDKDVCNDRKNKSKDS